jgi:hypothetical protein
MPNKGRSKRPTITSAILASPNTAPSELARLFSCSRIYVQKIREGLVREGKIGPRLIPTQLPSRPDKDAVAAAEAAFIEGDDIPMSLTDRRIFLKRLAHDTERDEIKVQAISALNRLEGTIQSTDDLGPSDPLTSAEADERITQLIEAREEVFRTHFHRRRRANLSINDEAPATPASV